MEEKPQSDLSPRLSSAAAVIDALGGTKAVAELLDVGQSAVSNYRKQGFPARSHFILSKLCAERGLNVADAVFGGFRRAPAVKPVYRPVTEAPESGLKTLIEKGFERITLPILQPAAPFIDRMGPEMQRRLYTFTDPAGDQLCLRPDLTIPTALKYIADKRQGIAHYCYQGTAFRYQPRGSGQPEEFTQLGLEIIGGENERHDEQTVIGTILDILGKTGLNPNTGMRISVTDFDMFTFFMRSLDLTHEQQVRVRSCLERATDLTSFQSLLTPSEREFDESPKTPFSIDPQTIIAGRSGNDILARLKNKENAQNDSLPLEVTEEIVRFLNLLGNAAGYQNLTKNFPKMKDWFEERVQDLAESIVPLMADTLSLDRVNFEPGINRGMAYYTGLSFSIYTQNSDRPIATGGRYDDLLHSLGAQKPVTAVGGAIALERLARAVESQNDQ